LAAHSPCSGPSLPGPARGSPRIWHDDLVRAGSVPSQARGFTARRRRFLAIAMLLLLVPLATGCLRVRASLTVSPDDLVSGEIIAAAKPRTPKDSGPQLDSNNLPFSQKVAVSNYDSDGYVGSQAVFSDLTFAELPQLANMNSDAQGVNLSLRRNGNVVILEGRADLTSVTDNDADVELTVAFPGAVTSTNGDRVEPDVVSWKLKPGVVSTMTAQAHYTDPNTRNFAGAGVWLGIASFAVAGVVALLAWVGRDRSPRSTTPRDHPPGG
jgi:phosphatidylinositol mannoside-binding LppM-like protein